MPQSHWRTSFNIVHNLLTLGASIGWTKVRLNTIIFLFLKRGLFIEEACQDKSVYFKWLMELFNLNRKIILFTNFRDGWPPLILYLVWFCSVYKLSTVEQFLFWKYFNKSISTKYCFDRKLAKCHKDLV